MTITIHGTAYPVELEQNALAQSICAMCPMELTLSRSGNHEYYASLPWKPTNQGAESTSRVEKNGLYYFAGWNAISLVFADVDIAPYEVQRLGRFAQDITDVLRGAGRTLHIVCDKQE